MRLALLFSALLLSVAQYLNIRNENRSVTVNIDKMLQCLLKLSSVSGNTSL